MNAHAILSTICVIIVSIVIVLGVSIPIALFLYYSNVRFIFASNTEYVYYAIEIPNTISASHCTYWIGHIHHFHSNMKSTISTPTPFPVNATFRVENVSQSLDLRVRYYNQLGNGVFQELEEQGFKIYVPTMEIKNATS